MTITGLRDPGYVDVVAQKVLEAVTAPIELEGRPVRVGASVGSAVFPSDATHATELLMLADTAMYRAKVQGKNRFVPFGAVSGRTPTLNAAPAIRGGGEALAEREGFEPSKRFDPFTRFPGELLQPLGHLSRRWTALVGGWRRGV